MSELFLKLLSMSLAASWLILAVVVLRLVLKRAPKWVNCVLWALVAVRLVCPFSFESKLSLIPDADIPDAVSSVVEMAAAEAVGGVAGPAVSFEAEIPVVAGPRGDFGGITSINTADVAAAVWLAGAALLLLHALISYLRLRRRVGAAMPLGDGVWLCDAVESPFILGFFRPRVYLPSHITRENMEHVLAHEQAHLRRRDHWWKPIGYVLLAVYWFNPLIWLAYILLCRDIELACDEAVIKRPETDRKAYSEALLACSVKRSAIAACPLAFGEVSVRARIKSVLNYRKPAFWVVLAALLACVVLAVCFLTDPVADDVDLPEELPSVADDTALGEDVPAPVETDESDPGQPLEVTEDFMTYEQRLAWAQSGEVYTMTYEDGGSADIIALDWREADGCLAYLWQYYGAPHPGICYLTVRFADDTQTNLPLPEEQSNRTAKPSSMEFREGKFLYTVEISNESAVDTYHYQVGLTGKTLLLTLEQRGASAVLPAPESGEDPYADLAPEERAAAFLANADMMSYEFTPVLMYGQYVIPVMEYTPMNHRVGDQSMTFDHLDLILDNLHGADLSALEPLDMDSFSRTGQRVSSLIHVGEARCRMTIWYDLSERNEINSCALVFTFADGSWCAFDGGTGDGIISSLNYAVTTAGSARLYAFPSDAITTETDVSVTDMTTGESRALNAFTAAYVQCIFANTPRLSEAVKSEAEFPWSVTLRDGSVCGYNDRENLICLENGSVYAIGGFEESEEDGALFASIEELLAALITAHFAADA